MATIVFADNKDGKITKSSFEAVSYANGIGGDTIVVTFGNIEGDGGLGNYGANKVLVASNLNNPDSGQVAKIVTQAANDNAADIVVFSHDHAGRMAAPRVAIKLDAGIVSGVTALPNTDDGFVVQKNVFSGKAMAQVSISSEKKVLTVLPNSIGVTEVGGSAEVSEFNADAGTAGVVFKEFKAENTEGGIPLPEAELVVSAGRGMKGPENWGMIEELASLLGAATACSRPVADIDWRPHHEHVGQTGLAIRPNLYIAVGISGAIQHLAGVNGSKVIVVINTDAEAPFFKAADYGIIGDAFEVLPKLIAAAKA